VPNIIANQHKCKLYDLPLFQWSIEHHRKPLNFSAMYLAGKYHLNPTQAALYAELMGLEGANDDY